MAKTALVTGSAGFVGSYFVRVLLEKGWNVVDVDIRESYLPKDALNVFKEESHSYDLVVHCAYEVGGRTHIDGINTAFNKNLILDSAMFEWAIRTKQRAVLYFSSSAAYPVHNQTQDYSRWWPDSRLHEDDIFLDDPAMPDANYGWAKLTGERLARSAADHGLRVHVVRPFSGCSFSQSLDYPWPSIFQRAQNRDFTVWGVQGQTRDWVDIDDVCEGALRIYEVDERRPVNLCTGRGVEMGQLMKMAAEQLYPKFYSPSISYLEDKPMGVYRRVGDPSRMLEHYTPKKDLEQMVDETVQKVQHQKAS